MSPLISVIVPVYNVEKFLDRCVGSIVAQTYKNLEILLIDDGSPDNCPAMTDEWAKKDSRIKVFHKTNGGLSNARNYGLDRASGDYVAFVDSDDYIDIEMYETMIKAILDNRGELACCGRFYVKGNIKNSSRILSEVKVFSNNEAIRELLNNGCVEEAVWDKLYRIELWDNLRFPENEINEDIVVMPEILSRCSKVIHVGKPFYYYCYNNSSITKSGYNKKKDIMLKHMKELSLYIKDNFPEEYKYVDVLRAKYTMTTMIAIVLAKEEKKFDTSYKKYRQILGESYKSMIRCENFGRKQKVEALLLILGVYRFVWQCKHRVNKR